MCNDRQRYSITEAFYCKLHVYMQWNWFVQMLTIEGGLFGVNLNKALAKLVLAKGRADTLSPYLEPASLVSF